MDNKNKGFPDGWGDNSDDEYGFVDDIDDEDDDDSESVWGNSRSPFKKNEPVPFSDANDKTNTQSEFITPNAGTESDME